MTLKSYILTIRFLVVFSLAAFASVVYYVDPESAGTAGKIVFFLVLFFFLSSLFNLILLRLRRKITKSENAHLTIKLSFRQGMLIAIFFIGIAFLQSMGILVWWDGLLLLAGVFLAELYFLSKD